jgi:hypothetical protein
VQRSNPCTHSQSLCPTLICPPSFSPPSGSRAPTGAAILEPARANLVIVMCMQAVGEAGVRLPSGDKRGECAAHRLVLCESGCQPASRRAAIRTCIASRAFTRPRTLNPFLCHFRPCVSYAWALQNLHAVRERLPDLMALSAVYATLCSHRRVKRRTKNAQRHRQLLSRYGPTNN